LPEELGWSLLLRPLKAGFPCGISYLLLTFASW
jgi:hypothetical protein